MIKQKYEKINEVVYRKTLSNGLKVMLIPRKGVSKIYGFFVTDFGSNDTQFVPIDSDEKVTVPKGVAHFLEHKLFEKKDYDVMERFGQLGAMPNAYTSFTETAYFFSATDYAQETVEGLLDFVQEPYFTKESVEREKGIIIQEANMYHDDPDRRLFMGCVQAMFKNHPVKNEVIGTIDSINATTKEDLYTCYNTFYHPSNMMLAISGNFEPEEMMNLIEANQEKKDMQDVEEIQRFYPDEPKEVAVKEKEIKMPVSIGKCVVGIKEYSEKLDEKTLLNYVLFPSMLLDHYFGKSGPFYKELYEAGIIDNSFSVSSTSEQDHGFSTISGNTKNPDLFAETIKNMLFSVKDMPITEKDLERMKKKRVGRILRTMNTIEYIAEDYVWYAKRGLDYFEVISVIQKMTTEDINQFVTSWIEEERLAVCKVIPQ